jgi:hypothetical protein
MVHAAGLVALLLASPASALPFFTATGTVNGSGEFRSGSISAGAERRVDGVGFHAFGGALASPFGLHASGMGSIGINSIDGRGIATARFDDFIIHGPAGPVTTSFNLVISGSLGVLIPTVTGDAQAQATGAVIVQTVVNGLIVTADGFFQDRVRLFGLSTSLGSSVTVQKTGMLAGWPGGNGDFAIHKFTTPTFTVNVDEPFTLEIQLTAAGGAFGFSLAEGVTSEGFADFGSTLAFPTTGAVFNLLDGYTVESVGARIAGNAFVGEEPGEPGPGPGPGPDPVPGVPEPASLALLLAGAAVLAERARRRRRERA